MLIFAFSSSDLRQIHPTHGRSAYNCSINEISNPASRSYQIVRSLRTVSGPTQGFLLGYSLSEPFCFRCTYKLTATFSPRNLVLKALKAPRCLIAAYLDLLLPTLSSELHNSIPEPSTPVRDTKDNRQFAYFPLGDQRQLEVPDNDN